MQRFDLNGIWRLTGGEYDCNGTIPGSVYSFLLDNKLIDDPFYRDNELKCVGIMDNEFEFSRKFDYATDGNTVISGGSHQMLRRAFTTQSRSLHGCALLAAQRHLARGFVGKY